MKPLYYNIYKNLSIILASFTLFSIFILSSSRVSADDSVIDDVSINVQVSCTMSGVGMNSHTTTINPGTYQTDIGKTTLTVFCNDNGGFAIYAIGYTGDTYTGTDHTKLIGEAVGEKIATGTATGSNTNDPSNWAMKLVKVTNASGQDPVTYNPENLTIENGYGNYSIVPDTYTKVASYSSTTDFTLGSKLETTYAAFVSSTQVADVYDGKVKYTLVHPATADAPIYAQDTEAGKIGYYPNAGGVTDTMGDQEYTGYTSTISNYTTPLSNGGEATLWASNFKRNNYGFVGWTDKYDWVLNENDANGNGTGANLGYHIYGPNATITLPSDIETKGLSLYAVWAQSTGNLQSYTCPDDTTMPIGKVTALTDQRDSNTYAIAKLADSNCWMIENLRLDQDADYNTEGTLAQGYGGQFAGLAEPEPITNFTGSSSYTADTIPNSLYYAGTQSGTATIDITKNYASLRMPRYNNYNTNSTISNMTSPTTDTLVDYYAYIYSYGNYYTWAAALANTTAYVGATNAVNGKTSETVNTSLCPLGWRLPYGRNTGNGALSKGFYYLNYKINNDNHVTDSTASNRIRAYPNNFLYSGSESNSGRGHTASYWSSTSDDNRYAFLLTLQSSVIRPATTSNYKYRGYSIRCVATGNQ